MSKLIVEVCRILNITEHPNADRLDIVTIKGWNCIVSKGTYKVGDLVVFCPPDSVIPQSLVEKYKLEYLKNDSRVKTVKLRGVISQGLVLDLPNPVYKEGMDVSEELGITKFEPPEPICRSSGYIVTKKRLNPYFDKYTDIENIKNYPSVFKENDEVVITEKIHGSNFRAGVLKRADHNLWLKLKNIFMGSYEFVYGSHNVQKTVFRNKGGFYKEDIYYKAVKKYNLNKILPNGYIIYGEVYGTGIQDLTYGIPEGELAAIFFDIKVNGVYLGWEEFSKFCMDNNLPIAPVIYKGPYSQEIVNCSTSGRSLIHPVQIREGAVIRTLKEEQDFSIGRKVLKSISADYLLRKGGTEYR